MPPTDPIGRVHSTWRSRHDAPQRMPPTVVEYPVPTLERDPQLPTLRCQHAGSAMLRHHGDRITHRSQV